jgi:tetratricopeptide (TPR) repeat protein
LSLLRASLALGRRDLDTALDHAEYARFLQQPLPAADVIIGEVCFRRGQLDEAAGAYQRALAAAGEQALALSGLAAIRLRQRDYLASIDYSLQALERDMRLAKTHYRLGLALIGLGRHAEAIAALEMAARLNPNLAGPRRFIARVDESL